MDKILLIEDNDEMREALTWELSTVGIIADSVSSFPEAIRVSQNYKIILSDFRTPEGDLTEYIEAMTDHKNIIVVTGSQEAYGIETHPYVYQICFKPFDIEEVSQKVRNLTLILNSGN